MTLAEIQALESLLARAKAGNDNHSSSLTSEEDETDDGTRRNPMCRIDGPFKHHKKFRVLVVDRETKKTTRYTYATREEAEAAIPKLARAYSRSPGRPMNEALAAYEKHLATEGNRRGPNKPRTIETTMGRLRAVFVTDVVTGDLTPDLMLELWERWAKKGKKVVPQHEAPQLALPKGKATDTALNTLAQVRTFLGWLAKQGWTKSVQLAEQIKVKGGRKKGKPKLSRDDAATLIAWCLKHSDDKGAVATAAAFLLGVRASELVTRQVGHLDGKGTLLDITEGKTDAAERVLRIPTVLQAPLARLAEGKASEALLFGGENRHWVLRSVKRCCKAAGVKVVTPHGLRGTHAKMAREVGVSGVALARALGHESESTTTEHYAGRAAVANAGVDQVVAALN